MKENRDVSIQLVFGHEKGYVNRPETDNGGPTNMGITLKTLSAWRGMAATIEMLRKLTRTEAYDIYAKNYWVPIRGDELPSGLDYAVFDSCVTSGPSRAIKILQEALVSLGQKNGNGTPIGVDGVIGIETLNAVYRVNTELLIRAYSDKRLEFMRSLKGPKGFPSNGRGWTIRVTGKDPKGQWADQPGVLGNAIKMAREWKSTDPVAGPKPLPVEIPPAVVDEIGAKANDLDIGLGTILKKKEALTGIVTSVVAVLTAVSGNTILSYALGTAIAVGALSAGFYFVRRVRRGEI